MAASAAEEIRQDQVEPREIRFARALESRGGKIVHARDEGHARDLLVDLLAGRTACVDDDPVVRTILGDAAVVDDPWEATVGVTTALCAAADTSTLAHPFDARHRRSTGLVPPTHVALLPVDRLRDTYAEVLQELLSVRPAPSGMRLETGPSSSGDIEQIHVRGMHGPVELVVLIVGSCAAEAEASGTQAAAGARQTDGEPTAEPAPPETGGPDAAPTEDG
ncbi:MULTISPECIES: LUD domain-containing protein [unclassified Ornithinimicrobium]|uniref:LUD domain-containing protein n=1 Tax=unclassified Ornithinimicrobium TaxID=2615080 RepID=UPI003851DDF0